MLHRKYGKLAIQYILYVPFLLLIGLYEFQYKTHVNSYSKAHLHLLSVFIIVDSLVDEVGGTHFVEGAVEQHDFTQRC